MNLTVEFEERTSHLQCHVMPDNSLASLHTRPEPQGPFSLSEFDLEIRHIAGLDNDTADFLSRVTLRGDPNIIHITEETDEPCLTLDHIERLAERVTSLTSPDWLQRLKTTQAEHQDVRPANAVFDKALDLWIIPNARWRDTIWLPTGELLQDLCTLDHNWAHLNWKQTYSRLRAIFSFPKLRKFIRTALEECAVCQRAKPFRRKLLTPATFDMHWKPFQAIHVDQLHLGQNSVLPNVHEVLTIIDRATGLLAAVPLTSLNAQQSLLALMNHWISRVGLPSALYADNGGAFRSATWQRMMSVVGVEQDFTLPYNLQANGKVERSHRTLLSILRSYEHPEL